MTDSGDDASKGNLESETGTTMRETRDEAEDRVKDDAGQPEANHRADKAGPEGSPRRPIDEKVFRSRILKRLGHFHHGSRVDPQSRRGLIVGFCHPPWAATSESASVGPQLPRA